MRCCGKRLQAGRGHICGRRPSFSHHPVPLRAQRSLMSPCCGWGHRDQGCVPSQDTTIPSS